MNNPRKSLACRSSENALTNSKKPGLSVRQPLQNLENTTSLANNYEITTARVVKTVTTYEYEIAKKKTYGLKEIHWSSVPYGQENVRPNILSDVPTKPGRPSQFTKDTLSASNFGKDAVSSTLMGESSFASKDSSFHNSSIISGNSSSNSTKYITASNQSENSRKSIQILAKSPSSVPKASTSNKSKIAAKPKSSVYKPACQNKSSCVTCKLEAQRRC